ncbi:serine/threonine-protein kinase 33-like [Stylophora pistillata]|nr:serine/threonine-protein kinase 33-like [Stylophora pistillata]
MQVIKGIITDLVAHFKSDDIANKFCSWHEYEIPVIKPTWEEAKSEVLRCISERAREFIQEWEDEKHHFAKSYVSLIRLCIEKYDIMEEDLRNVEEGALSENSVQNRPNGAYSTLPTIQPKTLLKKPPSGKAPVWHRQGLASVVLRTTLMASLTKKLKRNFQYKKKLEDFKTNPNSYMEKKSKKCLRIIANEDSLLPFINEQLEDAVQFLVQIKAEIPRIRDEELLWNQDDKYIVGKGTFSSVYSGILLQEGQPETKVALKVNNSSLRSSNVWHSTKEEKVLSAPARSEDQVARKKVLLWALQIIDALSYVHQQGYVHRDLKMDNVLLTADNRVKLSGTGTLCGSLLYMAPDILAGEMYDKKADMYSFGVLLWEMCYAETAFEIELFTQHSQFQLLDQIKDGLRPTHIKGTHEPLGSWEM